MSLLVCNGGLVAILEDTRSHYFNATCKIHLYQNNYTPTQSDTAASYTEATFDGYAAQNCRSWAAAFLNGSNQAETDHPPVTWTMTGSTTPNTIYGYYVTDNAGNLLWAELAPSSFSMDATGKTYTVNPVYTREDQL